MQIGCDYLVITRFDIARLLIAYDKICGNDGLPFSNGGCSNGHFQKREIELNYRVREDIKADLIKLKDVSHGLAKRLVATVLTDHHYSQDIVREAIADVIAKTKIDPYVRNEMVRARWGDNPAHIVWVHVAFDMKDVIDSNWVCSACWIGPDLPSEFHPFWKHDEEINGIKISWNPNYNEMKQLLSKTTGSKNEVVQHIERLLYKLDPIITLLDEKFKAFSNEQIDESDFINVMHKYQKTAREIYTEGVGGPCAPPECKDYGQRFLEVLSHFDTLFIYYRTEMFLQRTTENRKLLFRKSLTEMQERRKNLSYEREKLHSS